MAGHFVVERIELSTPLCIGLGDFFRHDEQLTSSSLAYQPVDAAREAVESARQQVLEFFARHAPELRFLYDSGQDAAMRVEEILREITREKG